MEIVKSNAVVLLYVKKKFWAGFALDFTQISHTYAYQLHVWGIISQWLGTWRRNVTKSVIQKSSVTGNFIAQEWLW